MTDKTHPILSPEEIAELERLLEKATKGPFYQSGPPWFTVGSGVLAGSPDPHAAPMIADCETWEGQREEDRQSHPHLGDAEDDAALIAAALTSLPALLAEIKRGREENRKLQAEVKDLRHLFDLARETGR